VIDKSRAEAFIENCPRNPLSLIARWGREPRTGVVIVACLGIMQSLQLATRLAQMTCQFVPLEFAGCRLHYLNERIPTTLNQEELVRIVTGTRSHRR